MKLLNTRVTLVIVTLAGLSGCLSRSEPLRPDPIKNVIFFLGDGMGNNTQTAARIYAKGEDGQLTIDTLSETAWIRTYSNDAQVTDSAPSMAAYMTGVKMNNEVISMSPDTVATPPGDNNTKNNCAPNNGHPVQTFLELAKASGRSVGAVTTTRVTHATPATTYAHICHRDLENDISVQMVPGGVGYNAALGSGLDVLMGGGRKHFLPNTVAGGFRTDGRDLTAELTVKGYKVVTDRSGFDGIGAADKKVVGLFTDSHMTYDIDRNPAQEPSLSEMALKALNILAQNPKGYFLMVEGGRIDHALHETNAARALQDTVAFDDAIAGVMARAEELDPGLKDTLIVVTADHDHTIVLNGYAKRTGKTTASNPGVLGLVKNVTTGDNELDAEGMPYTIIGFGNGENRVSGARSSAAPLTDATVSARDYHQEAAVRVAAGAETHGGTDVPAYAAGAYSQTMHGFMTNTQINGLLRYAAGL